MQAQPLELVVDEVPTAQAESLGLRSAVPGFRAFLVWTPDRSRPADVGYIWEIANGWVGRYDASGRPRMLPYAYPSVEDAVRALDAEDRAHLTSC